MPSHPIPALDPEQGIIDELQAWYLAKGEDEKIVFSQTIHRLIRRLYRDRDYLAKRKTQGFHTTYDFSTEQDLLAIAWAVQALVRYVPDEEQAMSAPPRPPRASPRPPRQSRKSGKPYVPPPRPGWEGPDLPAGELRLKKAPTS